MPMQTCSVIVPAYNCETTIKDTIAGVLAQDCSSSFGIVVVDDGSTDATAEAVKAFAQVKYLYQANAGPAVARNCGARAVQGDILFFTDSDCIPHKDWMEKILMHFNDPAVGAVAGSYGIANPGSWLASCIHAEIMFRHHRLMPLYPKAFGSYNVAIRREIFERVGGFDESYRFASGEDNDLSYKITKAGYKIYFERDALVDHHHPQDVGRYLSEQFRHGFWRAKMYRHHPEMMRGDDYTFFKDIVEMPFAIFGVLLAILSGAKLIAFQVFAFYMLFFLGFEVFYASSMLPGFTQRLVFSIVMLLRSFSRLAGFLSGFAAFSSPLRLKKV